MKQLAKAAGATAGAWEVARREGIWRNMGDPDWGLGIGQVHSTADAADRQRREGASGDEDTSYVAERKEIGP